MMLTAGIEAAEGKSYLDETWRGSAAGAAAWGAGAAGGWAEATGLSGAGCAGPFQATAWRETY